jgi:hypothetical protein
LNIAAKPMDLPLCNTQQGYSPIGWAREGQARHVFAERVKFQWPAKLVVVSRCALFRGAHLDTTTILNQKEHGPDGYAT